MLIIQEWAQALSIRAWAWESGFHPHAMQARPSEADTELDPAHSDSIRAETVHA